MTLSWRPPAGPLLLFLSVPQSLAVARCPRWSRKNNCRTRYGRPGGRRSSVPEWVYSRIYQPAWLQKQRPCFSRGRPAFHAEHRRSATLIAAPERRQTKEGANPKEEAA